MSSPFQALATAVLPPDYAERNRQREHLSQIKPSTAWGTLFGGVLKTTPPGMSMADARGFRTMQLQKIRDWDHDLQIIDPATFPQKTALFRHYGLEPVYFNCDPAENTGKSSGVYIAFPECLDYKFWPIAARVDSIIVHAQMVKIAKFDEFQPIIYPNPGLQQANLELAERLGLDI